MKKKVILVSDVHIKNRLWTNFSSVSGDSYAALQKIAAYVNSNKDVPSVCISCGDFFDSNRPSPVDLYEASKFIESFDNFLYIAGNHDDATPYLPSTLSCKCTLLDVSPVIVDNLYIFGVSHTPSKEKLFDSLHQIAAYWDNLGRPEDKHPVIVLHQALEGIQGNAIISPTELESIFTFPCKVFIGDTHVNVNFCKSNCDIISPGSLVPQNKAEALQDNYIYMLDSETGEATRCLLKVRHFKLAEDLTTCPSFPDASILPTVCLVRSNKVPSEWKQQFKDIIFIEYPVTVRNNEEQSTITATQDMSLKEAVYAEFENAFPEKADVLKQIFDRIENTEDPSVFLDKLLTKWKVSYVTD